MERIAVVRIIEYAKTLPDYNGTKQTWINMRERCNNPKATGFINYGARGITVCERWAKLSNFIDDMGYKPAKHLTIERINNNLGYSKENCKWATRAEQSANRRTKAQIEADRTKLSVCKRLLIAFVFIQMIINFSYVDVKILLA